MEKKLELKKEQIQIIVDYASIFETDAGKRVIEDLEFSFCGDCFISGDPYATHVRVGQNSVILYIKEKLKRAKMDIEEIKEEED